MAHPLFSGIGGISIGLEAAGTADKSRISRTMALRLAKMIAERVQ